MAKSVPHFTEMHGCMSLYPPLYFIHLHRSVSNVFTITHVLFGKKENVGTLLCSCNCLLIASSCLHINKKFKEALYYQTIEINSRNLVRGCLYKIWI